MLTIYKYPLHGPGEQTDISIPADEDFVHFDIQNGTFCIWCAVRTENEPRQRHYAIVGTGWDLSPILENYSIVFRQSLVDDFVWHLLELFGRK